MFIGIVLIHFIVYFIAELAIKLRKIEKINFFDSSATTKKVAIATPPWLLWRSFPKLVSKYVVQNLVVWWRF